MGAVGRLLGVAVVEAEVVALAAVVIEVELPEVVEFPEGVTVTTTVLIPVLSARFVPRVIKVDKEVESWTFWEAPELELLELLELEDWEKERGCELERD